MSPSGLPQAHLCHHLTPRRSRRRDPPSACRPSEQNDCHEILRNQSVYALSEDKGNDHHEALEKMNVRKGEQERREVLRLQALIQGYRDGWESECLLLYKFCQLCISLYAMKVVIIPQQPPNRALTASLVSELPCFGLKIVC